MVQNTCRLVRLVPDYEAAVLSYQLLMNLAEILDAKLSKEVKNLFLMRSSCLLMEQNFTVLMLCLLGFRR